MATTSGPRIVADIVEDSIAAIETDIIRQHRAHGLRKVRMPAERRRGRGRQFAPRAHERREDRVGCLDVHRGLDATRRPILYTDPVRQVMSAAAGFRPFA